MTATFAPTELKPIELDWFDETETVSVMPRDKMRFDIQKDRAIAALCAARRSGMFEKQFALLLNEATQWVKSNQAGIRDAFLTLQDQSLLMVVVQKDMVVSCELEDSLAALDIEIANDTDFDLVRLNTLLLPPASEDALMSFLSTELLVSLNGKRTGSHRSGK